MSAVEAESTSGNLPIHIYGTLTSLLCRFNGNQTSGVID